MIIKFVVQNFRGKSANMKYDTLDLSFFENIAEPDRMLMMSNCLYNTVHL